MKIIVTILQWLLSFIVGIFALGAIAGISDQGQSYLPLIFCILAFLIVFPPLQPVIEKFLPFLGAKALKLFLSVVLLIVGISFLDLTKSSIMGQVTLCPEAKNGVCEEDVLMLPRNGKFYLTGPEQGIKTGDKVDVVLNYVSEPEKSSELLKTTEEVNVSNDHAQIEIAPETLPVGGYEVVLTSELENFSERKKEFTVWDSPEQIETVKAKEGNSARITSLKLCNGADIKEKCISDSSEFPSSMTDLIAYLELGNIQDGTELHFIWRYLAESGQGQLPEKKATETLQSNVGFFTYTLTSEQGYPPGNYEAMIYLSNPNSKPILRKFSVK